LFTYWKEEMYFKLTHIPGIISSSVISATPRIYEYVESFL
jgi:hypothetical protein